jgi:hypothetical protein
MLAHYILYRARDLWPEAVTIRADDHDDQYGVDARCQPTSGVIFRSELEHHLARMMGVTAPTLRFDHFEGCVQLTSQGADEVYEYLAGLPVWQNLIIATDGRGY